MNRLDIASHQLDRVLSFFARVEAKASFVFAVDTAIVSLVAVNFRIEDFSRWQITVPAVLTLIVIGISVVFVYRCSFPSMDGGHDSLIYFAEIAKRREADFIERCLNVEEQAYVVDVLGQVWRNSEILTVKFKAIKTSFLATAIALFPFFMFLLATTVIHPQMISIR
jgi:hypothetical protein